MTQPKARRGRPPSLTREQIAKTVLDVGFANLTFAAVRDRLGVGKPPYIATHRTATNWYVWGSNMPIPVLRFLPLKVPGVRF